MERKILFLLFSSALIVQVSGHSGTYRGGVVDYHPVTSGKEEEAVNENVKNYVKFMKEAKSKRVDIIVFPEGGLNTKNIASVVPDPTEGITPCDDLIFPKGVVKDLSCASKENRIYSVVNLLEKRPTYGLAENDFYLYNTNVVFDRNGTVIARYAKYNLFDENGTNRTKDPEIAFFDTDFGVRFGTFICFDILFQTPTLRLVQQYRITDFVFSSYWFSELPFLTALQAQRGWAESNNVNLLASGVNNANTGSGGSGIYNGKYGDLVKTLSVTDTSELLVADVPKIQDRYSVSASESERSSVSGSSVSNLEITEEEGAEGDLVLLKDQIYRFKTEVIQTGKTFEKNICSHGNFCCDFFIDVDEINVAAKNYTYRAAVFNGVRRFGLRFSGGVQACGVILCNGPHLNNCTDRVKEIPGLFYFKEIRISGNFKPRNSFQMPSTLTEEGLPEPLSANKYEFTKVEKKNSVEVSLELLWPVTNLHTFAIWGRDFTRDNEPDVPKASGSLPVSLPCLIVTFVGFLIFAR